MDIHARILIDYSGSMGYMKGSLEFENKYLLPDGSPRIELVKKILIEDLIPSIQHFSFINIVTFSNSPYRSNDFHFKYLYSGLPNNDSFTRIQDLKPPPMGGTPIYTAFKRLSDYIKNNTLF